MKTSKLLLKFCSENGRAILTKTEREKLTFLDVEIARVQGHMEKFACGLTKRKLDAARAAYAANPSEANRAALDNIRMNWLAEDSDNQAQRSVINHALLEMATKGLRDLVPPILLRAANALAWLALQVQFEEEKNHASFEIPYQQSAIVKALIGESTQIRFVADRIASPLFTWNAPSRSVSGCDWLPDLIKIEGEVWNGETLDPDARRESAKWRNLGQAGNPLFKPLLCERDGTAATAEKGKAVKTYPSPASAKG